jgi:hypothetical protein
LKKTLALILLLGFLIRIAPLTINSFTGPDPFFHWRMSEQIIKEQKIPFFDSLSLQGRYYSYAPLFHSIFAFYSIISGLNVSLLIRLIPAIYGTIGVLMVFVFAKKIFNSKKIALFSAFILAISMLHLMRTAAYARPDGLALLLIPVILYFIFIKKFFLPAILIIALVLLHPLSTLYLLIFLIFWITILKIKKLNTNWKKIFSIKLIAILVFLVWLFSLPYNWNEYVSSISFESAELSRFDLASLLFYLRFEWIFLLIGLTKLKKQLFLKSWFAFSLFYAIIGARLAIFSIIPIALIAGNGFNTVLIKVKEFEKIFFTLIAILALISLFVKIDSMNRFVFESEWNAMKWVKKNTLENSSFMMLWDRGHPFTKIAERKTVIDGYFEFAPLLKERNDSMKILIHSSNCETIKKQVQKFGIDYFFVHKKGLSLNSFKYGILEANCEFQSAIFESNGAKIFKYN